MPVILSYLRVRDQQDPKLVWVNSLRDPISKLPNSKRAGGVAHMVEDLPCNCEALSSNVSAAKNK
jgi:hypothetical protein